MKRKILVVDDEPNLRKVLSSYLKAKGNEVTACSCGIQAISGMRENEWDVAFIDYQMLEMNGLDTGRALRRIDPRLQVVIMSGSLNRKTRAEIEILGYKALDKPFDLCDLQEIITKTN